jgi:uncharacterized protein DUF397
MTTADGLVWRMSSRSSNGVEVAPGAGGVVMRHGKHPSAGTITFAGSAWKAFVQDACDRKRVPTASPLSPRSVPTPW